MRRIRLEEYPSHLKTNATEDANGCWNWRLRKDRLGYGSVTFNGKSKLAHRVSFQVFNGYLDQDLDVLHTCDNRGCINPNHLYQGTHSDNMQDMFRRGRRTMRGVNNPAAKLTMEEVVEIKKRVSEGESVKVLSSVFNVHETTIRRINKRSYT